MNKKTFVEENLSSTIAAATSWVDHLTYNETEEIVTIVCRNNYKYRVNVACDSPAAIVEDVIREVLRH